MSLIVPAPTQYPCISLRDSERPLSKHKRCHGRNSTMWPPEYKTEELLYKKIRWTSFENKQIVCQIIIREYSQTAHEHA